MGVCAKWLLLIAMLASTAILRAEDTASILARLHAADSGSSLDDPTMKPWHLKVSFQLFDHKGQPSEQGTMEEWWNGPDLYKVTYTSPSFTSTEIRNQDGFFKTAGVTWTPYMLILLHSEVVRPMHLKQDLHELTPKLRASTIGNVKLDCISLNPPGKRARPPFPTYCLDSGIDRLRLTYLTSTVEVGRNTVGTFQQHSVALDFFVSDQRHQLMTAHVTALASVVSDAAEFVPSPGMSKTISHAILVSPDVTAGIKISGSPPTYPVDARFNHISGAVLLGVTIGTDGHVHHVEVVSSPDSQLSSAAVEAVKSWMYKPYLLNGAPVEMLTTVIINFNFGY